MSAVTPKGSPSDVLDDHWASELVKNVLTAIATENGKKSAVRGCREVGHLLYRSLHGNCRQIQ